MDSSKQMSSGALLLASFFGIVTAFLPWYTVGEMTLVPFSVSTGKILVGFGVITAIMAIIGFMKSNMAWGIVSIILGLLFVGVVYLNMPSAANVGEAAAELIKIETGFWLSMAAGGLIALTGIWKTITK